MKIFKLFKPTPDTHMSQTGRILKHLKEHGHITNVEMWNMNIQRGSERIRELKKEGYLITSTQYSKTVWAYVYKGHIDD